MLYLEDLTPGRTFATDSLSVSENEIRAFAAQFDPQPFHLDPSAAQASIFGRLVASGWHSAALTMRLLVTGPLALAGGHIGLQVESVAWPRPVLPGDTLRATSEVLDTRPSRSRPDHGVARIRTTTFNQHGEAVLVLTAVMLVQRRPA
jgi:acyl dehydratase